MNENLNRFETLKLATKYWQGDQETTTLIVVLFVLTFALLLIGGFLLQRYLKRKNARNFFERFAKNKELTDQEIEILWTYAQKMERDPMLVLEFKAPFEKVVDLYIKTDPAADESLVQDMRKKLDFVIQTPYIPLITTKDIEVFQNGRMIFSNNKAINVALYDKDERYMYWLAIDNDLPSNIVPSEQVKIVFVRNDDGIYTITLPIADIVREEGKTLVKLPHTFELHRTQRREFPRIKVNEQVKVRFTSGDEEIQINAHLRDISAGGGRICIEKTNEEYKMIKFGDVLYMRAMLDNHFYDLYLKVLEKDISPKLVCLRGIFVDMDEETREDIMEFVQKELLKIAQLKRYKQ